MFQRSNLTRRAIDVPEEIIRNILSRRFPSTLQKSTQDLMNTYRKNKIDKTKNIVLSISVVVCFN